MRNSRRKTRSPLDSKERQDSCYLFSRSALLCVICSDFYSNMHRRGAKLHLDLLERVALTDRLHLWIANSTGFDIHQIIVEIQAIYRTSQVLSMEDEFSIAAQCADCPRLYHAVETFRDAIIIVASTLKPDPDQFAFLSKKGEEGNAAANCFGWEQARDVIVNYRDLSEKPHRTSNTG
jgi:hypothetical protein